MGYIRLKRGREISPQRRHPWVFTGAVAEIKGNIASGDIVRVLDADGNFLAWGHFSAHSRIKLRLLEWQEKNRVDDDWWWNNLALAIKRRHALIASPGINAYRLVYAESDLLPGLIVDRYADYLVLQALTPGVDRLKHMLARQLMELIQPKGIFERSDAQVRQLEGLDFCSGVLAGEAPPALVFIREGGYSFMVDVAAGQKTGFYLDQRENRQLIAGYAEGRNVLDCFSYSGCFAVYVMGSKARGVTCLDSSDSALALAERNLTLNNLTASFVKDNAFKVLREYRDRGQCFDMIILDPPKLAPTKSHAQKAARAYKDLNLLALKLLAPAGILATFSCSAGIDVVLFRKIVFAAAQDAGREVQILKQLSQASDHPVRLSFPESEYLKGLVLQLL